MYDVTKENHKGFLKYSHRYLQEKVILLEMENFELKKLVQINEDISRKLADELYVLRQKFFANKQEKKKAPAKGKNNSKKKNNLPHNQSPVSSLSNEKISLETNDKNYSLNDFQCPCGDPNCLLEEQKGMFEESQEIDVVERRYIINRHLRHKYKGGKCHRLVTAPGPVKLVPGAEFSAQMAVEVVHDKFHDHLPLERQRQRMLLQGLEVSTQTLYNLTTYVATVFGPIIATIKQEILGQKWVHIDETPFKFFNPKKASGYVWALSNNMGVYYQFEPTRSGDVARELLRGYRGNVMTDGYSGYNWIDKIVEIVHVFCWSHVRRYFFDSMGNYPKASEMVDLIDQLFSIEHEAENFQELAIIRQEKSALVHQQIKEWIISLQGKFLKNSSFGKAVHYYQERELGLSYFLIDPYIPLSNNPAEFDLRRPVMGRKNYLFFRSIDGADYAVLFYTLINSCKKVHLVPKTYLLEMVLRKLKGERVLNPLEYAKQLRTRVEENLQSEIMSNFHNTE
jgi:transposase